MNSVYRELERIWQNCLLRGVEDLRDVIHVLGCHGISLRKMDGTLKQVNLSLPNTRDDAYVIGLRYIKNDGTCTEDHFLCEREAPEGLKKYEITHYPKRKLEYMLPEYTGTHKQQVDFNQVKSSGFNIGASTTDVRTLSYTGSFNKIEKDS